MQKVPQTAAGSAWEPGGPGETWGDLGRPGGWCLPQHSVSWGLGHRRSVQKACGCLRVREAFHLPTLATTGLYWKLFLFWVYLMGQSVLPVALRPDMDPLLPRQLWGLHCSWSPWRLLLGLGSHMASPAALLLTTITGTSCCHHRSQDSGSWKKRQDLLFTLEGVYNPVLWLQIIHKEQSLSVLIWSLLRYFSRADTNLAGCKWKYSFLPGLLSPFSWLSK